MKQFNLFVGFFICVFTSISSATICFDNLHRDVNKLVRRDCEMKNEVVKRSPQQEAETPPADQSMFQFTVDCQSTIETCNKIKSEFEIAGQEIAKTIKFNTQINVLVSFYKFCDVPEPRANCAASIGTCNKKKKFSKCKFSYF